MPSENSCAHNLGTGVKHEMLDRHWNAFRRGLRGDPPACVELLTMTFKPEAKVAKARGRVSSSVKTAWLTTYIGTLVALGLAFRNMQAVWASWCGDGCAQEGRISLGE